MQYYDNEYIFFLKIVHDDQVYVTSQSNSNFIFDDSCLKIYSNVFQYKVMCSYSHTALHLLRNE